MRILGISEPDSDAGAALIQDGEILYAANEERFSRKKLHQGFPYKTIEWLLAESGWSLDSIDVIAIAKPPFLQESFQNFRPYLKTNWFKGGSFFKGLIEMAFHLGYFVPTNIKTNLKLNREINRYRAEDPAVNHWLNMHEEPIVCTPQDAIRAYLLGALDVLAIGDFIVEQKA